MTKWISVKDKLPEHQTTCITYTPSSNIVCEADYEYVYGEGRWVDPVENYEEYKGITHWMPMPLPPEKDE